MKQHTLNTDQAWEVVVAFDYGTLAYSGRGMSGVECLGLEFDSVEDLVSWSFRMGQEADSRLVRLLSDVRIDDMGRGIVAYWPHIAPIVVEEIDV